MKLIKMLVLLILLVVSSNSISEYSGDIINIDEKEQCNILVDYAGSIMRVMQSGVDEDRIRINVAESLKNELDEYSIEYRFMLHRINSVIDDALEVELVSNLGVEDISLIIASEFADRISEECIELLID